MTQTFTMAFTAKCAECSVYARATACNLSGLFYILYKESASPCFFTLLQLECVWEAARAGGDEYSSSDLKRLNLLLKGGSISPYHISFLTCALRASPPRGISLTCARVDKCNTGRCTSEFIGEQLTNKAGVHAMPEQALTDDRPTPPSSLYICAGVRPVSRREYLACLNKLRFTHWLMENQRWRACVTAYRRSFWPPVLPSPPPSAGPSWRFLKCHRCF